MAGDADEEFKQRGAVKMEGIDQFNAVDNDANDPTKTRGQQQKQRNMSVEEYEQQYQERLA